MKPLTNWIFRENSRGCMYEYCGEIYEGAPEDAYFRIAVIEGGIFVNFSQTQQPKNPSIPIDDFIEMVEHLIENGYDYDQPRTE